MASFITREAQSITAGNCPYSLAAPANASYRGPEYPPHWDSPEVPEPETELSFCHCDLVDDEPCGGSFREHTIRIPDSSRTFTCYCCNECKELRTLEELTELAIEDTGYTIMPVSGRTLAKDGMRFLKNKGRNYD